MWVWWMYTRTLYAPHNSTHVCMVYESHSKKNIDTRSNREKNCIHDWPKCQQYDAITTELFYLKWSECWVCMRTRSAGSFKNCTAINLFGNNAHCIHYFSFRTNKKTHTHTQRNIHTAHLSFNTSIDVNNSYFSRIFLCTLTGKNRYIFIWKDVNSKVAIGNKKNIKFILLKCFFPLKYNNFLIGSELKVEGVSKGFRGRTFKHYCILYLWF